MWGWSGWRLRLGLWWGGEGNEVGVGSNHKSITGYI